MPDKIGFGEAFDGKFIKQMQDLNKEFKEFLVTYKALIKESKDNKELIQAAKSLTEINKAAAKANTTIKKLTATEKEQTRLLKATEKATTQASKAVEKERIAYQKANEAKRRATAESKKLAISQLGAIKSTNKFGVAIKSFLFKANFLANAMSNLASTIARQFVRALRGAFTVIKDFDGAVANLAAITGKTREEISELTKQAKELGAVTKFTASQITGLQIELAKLGFTTAEISASTDAISDFAAATGTELAESAKIVGVALRVFGLGANEAGDAAASLAIATTKSGLTAQQYETILSSVGPVARAYGFALEDITALTGALVTKGFEANKAATATRNIFLKLADSGGALSKEFGNSITDFDSLIKAMSRLNDEGVDLGRMLELTDVRSVAAFSALLEGSDSAKELRDSIEDVNEQLEEMVETQLDSIPGDVDLLKSAWQGLLLTMDSDGPLRFVLQWLTNATLQVSNLSLALRRFSKQTDDQLGRSFTLLESLTNKQGEHFSQMIDFFDEMSDEQLLSRGVDQMAKDFALIRKVSQKGGLALAEEYLRRREETAVAEIQLEKDKQVRITADAEKQAKARASIARRAQRAKEEAQQAEEEAQEEKRTKAVAEARKLLNDAYAESQRLIALIQPPDDLIGPSFDLTGFGEGIELGETFWDDFVSGFEFEATENEMKGFFANLLRLNDEFQKRKAKSDAEASEENRIRTIAAAGNLLQEGFNIFSGFQEREIQAIDEKQEREILAVDKKLERNELSEKQAAEQKANIEKRLQKERAKILTKQAKSEKAAALISIAINTAVAAMKVSGQTGIGAALAVPLVLALGAAQLAAVLSQPIPKFAKGTMSSPEGPAWTGEKGSELKVDPSGKMSLTPPKPTLDYLKKGTKIVPADITNQILKYSAIANGLEGQGDDNTILMLMGKLDEVKRAIKNKPVASSTQTAAGILTSVHRGNTTIKEMKRYIT